MAKRSKKTSSPIQAVPEDGLYVGIGIEDIEAGVAATSMAWMEVDYHEETWAPPPARPRPDDGTISPELQANLTPKQQLFVQQYLVDLNGTQAAIRAGYSKDTVYSIASENLRKPDILQAIEYALMERTGITRSRIVDELGAIAFSDLGDFVDWDNETQHVAADIKDRVGVEPEGDRPGEEVVVLTNRVVLRPSHKLDPALRRAVSKISQDRYGNVRIELFDKIAALDKLARALGMYQDAGHVEDNSQTTNVSATII
jgi:phage terminase small subunit